MTSDTGKIGDFMSFFLFLAHSLHTQIFADIKEMFPCDFVGQLRKNFIFNSFFAFSLKMQKAFFLRLKRKNKGNGYLLTDSTLGGNNNNNNNKII